jgi:murein DD-endopeptidase MepM/ murein hydrolase activator NlpD
LKKYIVLILLNIIILQANTNKVYIKNEKNGLQINTYIINKNLFDITLLYKAKTKNLVSSNTLPIQKVIKAKTKKLITTFYIKQKKFSLRSSYTYTIGSKYSIHNDKYLYRLPYKLGTSKLVTQSFNGKFSHFGNSQYAVDFAMKIGTKIYASRDGIVIMTKNNGSKSGSKKYIKEANFITIKHKDGTYAKYAHLKKGGVRVKVGQKVKRGQFIGFSGNTGYTKGPHLHFVVFKGKSYNSRQSIPIKFISASGIVYKPIRFKKYKAVK